MVELVREYADFLIFMGGLLFISLCWQVDRLSKQLNEIASLLLHIEEVRDGSFEQYKIDKEYEDEARRRRWKWLRFWS